MCKNCICYDDLEGYLRFYQGEPTHELQDYITAEELNQIITKMRKLMDEAKDD